MSTGGESKRPIDQLVDLFVYAPLGFLYERDEVLDRVVTRGKSQVQLARLMAKMASQQPGGTEALVGDAVGFAADVVSKGFAEFGVAFGLVPKPADDRPTNEPTTVVDVEEVSTPEPESVADVAPAEASFPIDDYDELNARTIIAALGALSPVEVQQVADHERAGRNRKTILAKAERLTA